MVLMIGTMKVKEPIELITVLLAQLAVMVELHFKM